MLTMKNIRPYTPENVEALPAIVWLESEDGMDWYFHRARFQPDTMKICYDDAGRIICMTRDVTSIFPAGLSVTEISAGDVPEGADISGRWIWDGRKIVRGHDELPPARTREEIMADLNRLRDELESLDE